MKYINRIATFEFAIFEPAPLAYIRTIYLQRGGSRTQLAEFGYKAYLLCLIDVFESPVVRARVNRVQT